MLMENNPSLCSISHNIITILDELHGLLEVHSWDKWRWLHQKLIHVHCVGEQQKNKTKTKKKQPRTRILLGALHDVTFMMSPCLVSFPGWHVSLLHDYLHHVSLMQKETLLSPPV